MQFCTQSSQITARIRQLAIPLHTLLEDSSKHVSTVESFFFAIRVLVFRQPTIYFLIDDALRSVVARQSP